MNSFPTVPRPTVSVENLKTINSSDWFTLSKGVHSRTIARDCSVSIIGVGSIFKGCDGTMR